MTGQGRKFWLAFLTLAANFIFGVYCTRASVELGDAALFLGAMNAPTFVYMGANVWQKKKKVEGKGGSE